MELKIIPEFSKYNRFFVTPKEINHDKFPFVVSQFVMLCCISLYNKCRTYKSYIISIITYVDESKNQIIKDLSYSMDFDENSEIIKYYEENYKELNNSFEPTFIMMYNNVKTMEIMSKGIINIMNYEQRKKVEND